MLTAGEIAQMRTVAETTFDSTAVIQGGTVTGDTGGGGTTSWVVSGTAPCHISPNLARGFGDPEGVSAGRVGSDAGWIVTLPAETSIGRDDRLLISGVSYEVAAFRAPRTWELTRRVEVSQVT